MIMKAWKRKEIEIWTKADVINVLYLQETHLGSTREETPYHYTWYLLGMVETREDERHSGTILRSRHRDSKRTTEL